MVSLYRLFFVCQVLGLASVHGARPHLATKHPRSLALVVDGTDQHQLLLHQRRNPVHLHVGSRESTSVAPAADAISPPSLLQTGPLSSTNGNDSEEFFGRSAVDTISSLDGLAVSGGRRGEAGAGGNAAGTDVAGHANNGTARSSNVTNVDVKSDAGSARHGERSIAEFNEAAPSAAESLVSFVAKKLPFVPEPSRTDATPDKGWLSSLPTGEHAIRLVLVFVLLILATALGAAVVLVRKLYACVTARKSPVDKRGSIRKLVEALPALRGVDVESMLPPVDRCDGVILRPFSARQMLRIQVEIVGPQQSERAGVGAPPSQLIAPLMQRSCVLYTTVVTRRLHVGTMVVPVAFSVGAVDFIASPVGKPELLIQVVGADVSLYDMCGGRLERSETFANAPDHWQDFVLVHRAERPGGDAKSSAEYRADSTPLEFQERALLVGARATLIGELHRGSDGGLSLRPLHEEGDNTTFSERVSQDDVEATIGSSKPSTIRLFDDSASESENDVEASTAATDDAAVPSETTPTATAPAAAVAKAALSADRWRTSWENLILPGVNLSEFQLQAPDAEEDSASLGDKVLASDDSSLLLPEPQEQGSRSGPGGAAHFVDQSCCRTSGPEVYPGHEQ